MADDTTAQYRDLDDDEPIQLGDEERYTGPDPRNGEEEWHRVSLHIIGVRADDFTFRRFRRRVENV